MSRLSHLFSLQPLHRCFSAMPQRSIAMLTAPDFSTNVLQNLTNRISTNHQVVHLDENVVNPASLVVSSEFRKSPPSVLITQGRLLSSVVEELFRSRNTLTDSKLNIVCIQEDESDQVEQDKQLDDFHHRLHITWVPGTKDRTRSRQIVSSLIQASTHLFKDDEGRKERIAYIGRGGSTSELEIKSIEEKKLQVIAVCNPQRYSKDGGYRHVDVFHTTNIEHALNSDMDQLVVSELGESRGLIANLNLDLLKDGSSIVCNQLAGFDMVRLAELLKRAPSLRIHTLSALTSKEMDVFSFYKINISSGFDSTAQVRVMDSDANDPARIKDAEESLVDAVCAGIANIMEKNTNAFRPR